MYVKNHGKVKLYVTFLKFMSTLKNMKKKIEKLESTFLLHYHFSDFAYITFLI